MCVCVCVCVCVCSCDFFFFFLCCCYCDFVVILLYYYYLFSLVVVCFFLFFFGGGGGGGRVSVLVLYAQTLSQSQDLLKCKPHEALQSLVATTCGQPWVGFAACTPREEGTRSSPLAWRPTDRMFTPGHSEAVASTLYFAPVR